MTIKQIKKEYNELRDLAYKLLKSEDYFKVIEFKCALLHEKGYAREYIASNAKKAEIMAHYTCLSRSIKVLITG